MRGFGDLEAIVIDHLWSRAGMATVREVFEELRQQRKIAYTTVLSTMDNLHRKGVLSRERDGKAYRYRPTLSREEYSARLMRDALAVGGDPDAVLARFLEQMTEEESARLQVLVRRWASGR